MNEYSKVSATKALASWLLCAPLLAFALPLGMGNESAQIVAGVLIMPYLFAARARLLTPFLFAVFVSVVSVYQILSADDHQYSMFQFARAALPLLAGCVVLVGYDAIFRRFRAVMDNSKSGALLNYVMMAFAIGQVVQVCGSFSGSKLRTLSSSPMTQAGCFSSHIW